MTTERTQPGRKRSERKREQIIHAALPLFLAGGYLGTSVDDIATAAGASKRTVYSHFGDKESLFRSVIAGTITPMQQNLQSRIDLAAGQDPRESLQSLIHSLGTIILEPDVIRLRRVVIAECDRFPDLAAEWYRLGPEQTVERLSSYLAGLAASGALHIEDSRLAAEHLLWLAISTPLNRLMFAPSGTSADPAQLERNAKAAFELFWSAYGGAN